MAVTEPRIRLAWVTMGRCLFAPLLLLLCFAQVASGAVLPEDNLDLLYHRYEGGGMVIDGPSLLVRKSAGPQVSFSGQYYVDTVSAASVDVMATASPYVEERTEITLGVDYLHENAILSLSYVNSSEDDYKANTLYFSAMQEFFGGLSTLKLGYARGRDEVRQRGNSDFSETAERQNFQLGLSQVLTRNALINIDLEAVTDQGFLQSPYQQNRYIDPLDPSNFLYQPERYPQTRTSLAVAAGGMYYLPYRASVKGEYRYFTDSWGISGYTAELAYVHPVGHHWIWEGRVRYYNQEAADFYSDLFPFENSQTHMSRDKEMSRMSSTTLGAGVSYEWQRGSLPQSIDRLKLSLLLDYIDYRYDNFRDVTASGDFMPGEEPRYSFDALVTRASLILAF